MQFRNVPIGKVESKFLKLRKQLKRKQKETMYGEYSVFVIHHI